mgnify:CR=1 FL=1
MNILKLFVKTVYSLIPFKKYLFLLVKSIYTPSQNVYQHLTFKGIFKVFSGTNSFKIINTETIIENQLFWKGLEGFEPESLKLWARMSKNADVIFSDKVISLNDKVNKNKKIKDFRNFQINSKLMSFAKKDTTFLHCLPRGEEVTGDVFLGKNSEVWLQALNRVHVQKSILLYCFGKLR